MSVVTFAALIATGYCTETEADELFARLQFKIPAPVPSIVKRELDEELAKIRQTEET